MCNGSLTFSLQYHLINERNYTIFSTHFVLSPGCSSRESQSGCAQSTSKILFDFPHFPELDKTKLESNTSNRLKNCIFDITTNF